MTKTIHYCDRCGEETKRVVKFPKMRLVEFDIVWNNFDKIELCKECAKGLVYFYNHCSEIEVKKDD